MNQRIVSAKNKHQGTFKRVLCVCTSGCLRSPTAAFVLSQEPFNYNTRAVGISIEHAIIPIDNVLLEWAQEIVVFDWLAVIEINDMLDEQGMKRKPIINLEIPDEYDYRQPELIQAIKHNYIHGE